MGIDQKRNGIRMSKFFLPAVIVAVLVGLGVLIWAYITTIGLMTEHLGISTWEAVALLVVASAIFGSAGRGRR